MPNEILHAKTKYNEDGTPKSVTVRVKGKNGAKDEDVETADTGFLAMAAKPNKASEMAAAYGHKGPMDLPNAPLAQALRGEQDLPIPATFIEPTTSVENAAPAPNADFGVPMANIYDPLLPMPASLAPSPAGLPSGEQGDLPASQDVPVSAAPSLFPSQSGGGIVDLEGSKTTYNAYNPADEAGLTAAFRDADKSRISEQDALIAQNKVKQDRSTAESLVLNDFMQKEEARRAIEQDKVDQKDRDYQAEVEKTAGMKLTTPHMFYGQSTGNQILAAISVSLGAMGQALGQPGTENAGIKAIQATLDRDIAEQKYNMDNQKDIMGAKRTLYQDLVKKYGDERAARATYQEMVMNKVGKEYEARELATNDPIIKARIATATAEAKVKEADAKLQRSKVLQEKMHDQKQAVAVPSGNTKAPQSVLGITENEDMIARENFLAGVRELRDAFKDPANAAVVGKWDAGVEGIKSSLGLEAAERYTRLQAMARDTQQQLTKIRSGAGFGEKEREDYKAQIGQVGDNPKNAAAKLDRLGLSFEKVQDKFMLGTAANYQNDPRVLTYFDTVRAARGGSKPGVAPTAKPSAGRK